MSGNRRETIVWDNIPEWAIYALEYGIDEELFITDEDREMVNRFITENFPKVMSCRWTGNRTASLTAIRHSASPARPIRSLSRQKLKIKRYGR